MYIWGHVLRNKYVDRSTNPNHKNNERKWSLKHDSHNLANKQSQLQVRINFISVNQPSNKSSNPNKGIVNKIPKYDIKEEQNKRKRSLKSTEHRHADPFTS